MKDTWINLFTFLKAPYLSAAYTPIKAGKFFTLLILTFALIVPYGLIMDVAGIDQFDHIGDELFKKNKWLVSIVAIVLAPIMEEPIFRLHLDLKRSSIWWSIGLSVLLLGELWVLVVLFWIYLFVVTSKV